MDPHLSSVINKRKSAILCSVIEYRRGGKPDEKINEQLRSPWFLRFLGDAFDAIPQGNTLVQFYRDKKTGWLNYIFIPRKHYDPIRKLILKRQHDITGIPWDEFDDLLFIGEPRSLGELAKLHRGLYTSGTVLPTGHSLPKYSECRCANIRMIPMTNRLWSS